MANYDLVYKQVGIQKIGKGSVVFNREKSIRFSTKTDDAALSKAQKFLQTKVELSPGEKFVVEPVNVFVRLVAIPSEKLKKM